LLKGSERIALRGLIYQMMNKHSTRLYFCSKGGRFRREREGGRERESD